MSFQNIPVKAIPTTITGLETYQEMGFYLPGSYLENPEAIPLPFRWLVTMTVTEQLHSSSFTRSPGRYNGMDINVGQWIAETNSGICYQIISILSKTDTQITCIIQDVFRYNSFRDPNGNGGGGPSPNFDYVVFDIKDDGTPIIDPKPSTVVNESFWQNLTSRFSYVNYQYDFSLFQRNNNFKVNDVISVDPVTRSFVKADSDKVLTVGIVTSISDTMPNWFTVNSVSKIDDFLNYLPGNIGDIIYTDPSVPGSLTTNSSGKPVYLKLRNNGQTQIKSVVNGSSTSGNVLRINNVNITVSEPGDMNSLVSDFNAVSLQTEVNASIGLVDNVVNYNPSLQGSQQYLLTSGLPAKATINGVEVTFDIARSWGTPNQAWSDAMASAINATNIPGIVASSANNLGLTLTNTTGQAITIVNTRPDSNGVNFAGSNSASGIPLSTSAKTDQCIVLTAVDARPIDVLYVIPSIPVLPSLGLISAENAPKASGLFIGTGLRQATYSVVADLAARDALTSIIGDAAYVIDSDDGNGNYVNQWSTWLYNGSVWTLTGRQSQSTVAAKTIQYAMTHSTASSFNIGSIVTGTRVTVVTVEVLTPFNSSSALLELGYTIANPITPTTVSSGLMTSNLIDLSKTGIYVTTGDILFGTNTVSGDITLTGTYVAGGATQGSARILISYV
jgi:hypothetical protein